MLILASCYTDVFFGKELTFTAWLTVGAFLSGLNFIDLFKDSLWAARSERLLTCGVHGP